MSPSGLYWRLQGTPPYPPSPPETLRLTATPHALTRKALTAIRQVCGRKGCFTGPPDVLLRLGRTFEVQWPKHREVGSGLQAAVRDYLFSGRRVLKGSSKSSDFSWKRRTVIMGILNVTPDSFADGGRHFDPARAVERALRMQEEGADWIDVGGESTRPGAGPVSAVEEKARVLPVLRACARVLKVPLSIDTSKASVARAAVGEGAAMVNDVGALRLDPSMAGSIARLKVPVVLMHMLGRPRTMQKNPRYRDVTGEVLGFLAERIEFAVQAGIGRDKILLDPGFGFGKTPAHNLEITRKLHEFRVLGRPLLMGLSRKSTLGALTGGLPPPERLEATLAALCASILAGADWVRVHDVKETVRAARVADALRYSG